jgi:hypothetical protein
MGQSYDHVDSMVGTYPGRFRSEKKMATRIKKDFKQPEDRARAIYTWIALHVKYGKNKGKQLKSFRYRTPERRKAYKVAYMERLSRNALKQRTGVCQDYAALFWKVSELCEMESAIISGHAKTEVYEIGKTPDDNHAWNAIRINNTWSLIDVTWAAGYVDHKSKVFQQRFTGSYFMTPPDVFFLNHFPKDTTWLFADKTISEFSKLPLYHRSYLDLTLRIEIPQQGVIQAAAGEEIEFSGVANDSLILTYAYKKDKYSTRIKYELENGRMTFKVPVSITKTDYLTIYKNYEGLVTYKVEIAAK